MLNPKTSFTELVIPELILETLSINGIFWLNLKYPYAISISIKTKKSGIAMIKILPYCSIRLNLVVYCMLYVECLQTIMLLGQFEKWLMITFFVYDLVSYNLQLTTFSTYNLLLFQPTTLFTLSPHSTPLLIIANIVVLVP